MFKELKQTVIARGDPTGSLAWSWVTEDLVEERV